MPQIGEHITFKGGTSLSKVFHLIDRFSEDIDLSFGRSYLGKKRIQSKALRKNKSKNE